MIRKVLVALDGSKRGEAALDPAVKLVRAYDGTVVLFHAVAPAESPSLAAAEYVQRQRARAAEYLRGLAAPLRKDGTPVVEQIVTGDAAREIVSQAHRGGAGMIALSSHGGGGGQPWPFGSVTEKVIRTTTLPVLVFRGEAGPSEGIRRILIALDGSESAMDVVPPASDLAAALGASIVLAHVGEHLPLAVHRAVNAIHNMGIPLRTRLLHGDPASCLAAAAEEEHVDLVAMATAGADLRDRTLTGDVGSRIVSGSVRPLLMVRPRSAA